MGFMRQRFGGESAGQSGGQGKGITMEKTVRPGVLSHWIIPWCCCTKV
jgi:hypothetical protein